MASHVSCKRGGFSLNINLNLSADLSWLGIVGPSGAGKSTFMRCVAGLEKTASVNGFAEWSDTTSKKPVLVSAQTPLFPALTVMENLKLVARHNGLVQQDFLQIIEDFECQSLVNKSISALSGGEVQRVIIARAIMTSPSLLLLDESTSAMDTKLRARLLTALKRYTEASCKVLWVSHDWRDIAQYCDEVAVIKQGRCIIQDRPAAAFAFAESAQSVDTSTGCILQGPVLESEAEFLVFAVGEHKVVTRAMETPAEQATLLVDPRQVLVARESLAPLQVGYVNRLPVVVEDITSDAAAGVQRLTLNCEGQQLQALLEAPAAKQFDIKAGERVFAYFGAGTLS